MLKNMASSSKCPQIFLILFPDFPDCCSINTFLDLFFLNLLSINSNSKKLEISNSHATVSKIKNSHEQGKPIPNNIVR